MDLRQLKYFVAVAEQENFSRAAQQLYVAQSALSRRMRDLEEELGVRLFDRHLRGAALTAEGRELLERARYLLRSFAQLKSDLVEPRAQPFGPVGVGMTPNFGAVVGAAFAREVVAAFPDARLRVVEAYSPELREMVRSGAIDMAACASSAWRATRSSGAARSASSSCAACPSSSRACPAPASATKSKRRPAASAWRSTCGWKWHRSAWPRR
jgi:DNA-binding transcriptional LysR family regulator